MQDTLKIPSRPPEDMRLTPDTGLTEEQAAQRQRDGLANTVTADPGKSVWQILWGNLFNLFNLLNFALAACLLLVGSYRNMLFLGVVFSNTLIGTVQELRAKRTIERLTAEGLAQTTHGRLCLTERGMDVLNAVIAALV